MTGVEIVGIWLGVVVFGALTVWVVNKLGPKD